MARKEWKGTTYGNSMMHKRLIALLRHVDVRFVYLFAYIFVVPICIILNHSSKTAYRYFRDIHGYGKLKAAWNTYVNHCMFAQTVIDKFAMYAGRKFDVVVEGLEFFQNCSCQENGFLLLSSHIGNYEIAGYSLVSARKKIHAVVYADEKASVMANRDNMFCKTNVDMIALSPDMSYLFEIDKALSSGDIVSFPSDRFMGHSREVECTFFGKPAKFPLGPFTVATMRSLDVLAVNVMKTGTKKYVAYVTPLHYDTSKSRKEQTRQLAEAYVSELEKRLRQYPTQWYNFFDFWQ